MNFQNVSHRATSEATWRLQRNFAHVGPCSQETQRTNNILSVFEFDVCNTLSNCLLLNVQQFSGFGPQNTISPVFWQLHDFPNIEALTFPNPLIIPTVNLTNGETLPYLIKGKSPHSCNIEKNLAKILKNIEKGKIGSDLCKHFLPHFSRTAQINKDHATLSKLCRKNQNQNSEALPAFEGRWVKIRDKAREMRIILSSLPPTARVGPQHSTYASTSSSSPSSLPQSSSFLKSLSLSPCNQYHHHKRVVSGIYFFLAPICPTIQFSISPDPMSETLSFLFANSSILPAPPPTRCRSLQSAPI